jgi:hypothetical protein
MRPSSSAKYSAIAAQAALSDTQEFMMSAAEHP